MDVLRGAGALLLITVLSTGGGESVDTVELAAAKCGLPVYEELGDSDTRSVERDVMEVLDLGDGDFRINGTATVRKGQEVELFAYECEVTPDDGDSRGFRVTRLEVDPLE